MQRNRRRGRGASGPGPGQPDPTPLPSLPSLPVESVQDAAPPAGPRVRRIQRRPPVRYRDDLDGEEFDIDDHSDVSEEEHTDDEAPNRSNCRPAPVVPNTVPSGDPAPGNSTPNTTVTDPLATNRSTNSTVVDPLATNVSSTSNKALDIEYFFRKEKENTICNICE